MIGCASNPETITLDEIERQGRILQATGKCDTLDNTAWEAECFLRQIHRRLQTHWQEPAYVHWDEKTVVRLALDREGYVTSRVIVESKGNTLFDRSILEAIDRAQPLPVPDGDSPLRHSFNEVVVTFHPKGAQYSRF